jgi:hypothetical protein
LTTTRAEVSIVDAEREYGVSRFLLRKLEKRGVLPTRKVGHERLIDCACLEELLANPELCPGCGAPLPFGYDWHKACRTRANVAERLSREGELERLRQRKSAWWQSEAGAAERARRQALPENERGRPGMKRFYQTPEGRELRRKQREGMRAYSNSLDAEKQRAYFHGLIDEARAYVEQVKLDRGLESPAEFAQKDATYSAVSLRTYAKNGLIPAVWIFIPMLNRSWLFFEHEPVRKALVKLAQEENARRDAWLEPEFVIPRLSAAGHLESEEAKEAARAKVLAKKQRVLGKRYGAKGAEFGKKGAADGGNLERYWTKTGKEREGTRVRGRPWEISSEDEQEILRLYKAGKSSRAIARIRWGDERYKDRVLRYLKSHPVISGA